MLWLIISSIAGVLLLALSDKLRRKYKIGNEISRKSVHTISAVVVATWPHFVSYKVIIEAELIFLLIVAIAHHQNLFGWIRDVGRKTWGEYFFPAGIIIAALMHPPAWIFSVAMLNLGLADSMAAIIGSHYGKKSSFKIFGYTKSIAGLGAFWITSLLILSIFALFHHQELGDLTLPVLFLLPISLAVLESICVWGIDNTLVPIATILALKFIT